MGIRINSLNIGQIRFNGTNIASVKAGGAIRWSSSVAPVTKYGGAIPLLYASAAYHAVIIGASAQINGGEYLICAGGTDGTIRSDAQAYSGELVATALTTYPYGYCPSGGSNGVHAVFVSGKSNTGQTSTNTNAYVYNPSLVQTTVNSVIDSSVFCAMTVQLGDKVVFVGGRNASAADTKSTAYSLNRSLVKQTLNALTTSRSGGTSIPIGGGALIAGGYTNNGSTTTDLLTAHFYDSGWVKTEWTNLPEAMCGASGTNAQSGATVGGKGLIAGGRSAATSVYKSSVYCYTAAGVLSQLTSLPMATADHAHLSMANHAVFAGGRNSSSAIFTDAVSYNSALVQEALTPMSAARGSMFYGVAGRYGLLVSGRLASGYATAVDAYSD